MRVEDERTTANARGQPVNTTCANNAARTGQSRVRMETEPAPWLSTERYGFRLEPGLLLGDRIERHLSGPAHDASAGSIDEEALSPHRDSLPAARGDAIPPGARADAPIPQVFRCR